jgi:hypothetical protein
MNLGTDTKRVIFDFASYWRENKDMTGARTKFIPLLGLLIVLALAYGLYQWLFVQWRVARGEGAFPRLFIAELASGMFLIVIWLALGWITLGRSQRSVLVSVIFLALGFLVYFYPYLQQLIPWLPFIIIFNAYQPLSYTGIFISVLGVLHLLLPASSPVKS